MPKKTGTTKQIVIDVLVKHGPQTSANVAALCGLKEQTVRVCISAMITRFGGVFRVAKRGHEFVYGIPGLHEPEVQRIRKALRGPVAGPRYVGDMHATLRRDPYEHMKLAMAARGAA